MGFAEGAIEQARHTRTQQVGAQGHPEDVRRTAAEGYVRGRETSRIRLGHNGGRPAPLATTQTPPPFKSLGDAPPVGKVHAANAAEAKAPPMSRQAAEGTMVGLLAGAAIGFLVGGPVGAIFGAVIGLFIGAYVRSENKPIFNFGGNKES
jgi:hypothetical protein